MILKKHKGNPVLSPVKGSYWESEQVRNPSAILHEGKVHMLYTATDDMVQDHFIHLGHAVSSDGIHFERVSSHPAVSPSLTEFGGFDAGSVEDPRCVKIGDTYYITYMARATAYLAYERGFRRTDMPSDAPTWKSNFRRGGLITTKDFKTFTRHGPITSDEYYDANCILFPEKINGRFALLHRPSQTYPEHPDQENPGMSICFSKDLINWEDDQVLMMPRNPWEKDKIGGSAPPIKTDKGWLSLYHGVQWNPGDGSWPKEFIFCYSAGLFLMDLKDPTKVIARSPEPILVPEAEFEKHGTQNNVVFPTGNVVLGDDLFVYYGGADTVVCLATAKVKDLLDYVLQFPVK